MQMILWIVTGISLAAAGITSARLWCYRKQIAHMREELSILEQGDTNYRLSSYCHIGETEALIEAVNRVLARNKEETVALRAANRSYRESITSISHDIRTPLTSAKGYVQMLRKDSESGGAHDGKNVKPQGFSADMKGVLTEQKRQEYVRIVEQRLADVTDMLGQLFEYARIEAGEMQYEPEVLNAGNLFAETVSMFYEDFLQKGCEPEVEIRRTPCHIYADRHAYVRIIENLIKNALVHGTGEYCLSLCEEDGYVKLSVSNRTDSIEQKDIESIFDRFYTTDVSRSRKTTGLGLAIVKRFTEQMGGTAEAFLEDGCFTITVSVAVYADKSVSSSSKNKII